MRIVEFKNIDQKRLVLKELSPARIHHAEDLIFWEGSAGAMRAVQQLEQLAKGNQLDNQMGRITSSGIRKKSKRRIYIHRQAWLHGKKL